MTPPRGHVGFSANNRTIPAQCPRGVAGVTQWHDSRVLAGTAPAATGVGGSFVPHAAALLLGCFAVDGELCGSYPSPGPQNCGGGGGLASNQDRGSAVRMGGGHRQCRAGSGGAPPSREEDVSPLRLRGGTRSCLCRALGPCGRRGDGSREHRAAVPHRAPRAPASGRLSGRAVGTAATGT